MKKTLAERFWLKVDKSGGEDACWPWTGCVSKQTGYGSVGIGTGSALVHRVAFFLTHGRWPEPFCLHRCDNRPCCNPDHLFEGTNDDNMKDMAAKGRGCVGQTNGQSKLTEQQVRAILQDYVPYKVTCKALAQRFGVSERTVNQIINGERWVTLQREMST